MKTAGSSIAILLALSLGTTAWAQSTDDTTPAPTDDAAQSAETAPADDTATDADAAEVAAEQSAEIGEPAAPEITVETFGDWEVRCTADKSECFMYQLVQDNAENPVAEFTVIALPDDAKAVAGVTVVTPLGTMLDVGLLVQVDSGEARKYNYTWCDQSGCFARFGFEADMLNNYKRGNTARMRLVSVSRPDQPVDLGVSLTGFTGAFNAISEARKAVAPAE